MNAKKSKIINDPVHGFLSFSEPEIMTLIDHPWFQRLRHIMQMGVAHLVYPGAVHTRFLHSLGACHLMGKALDELAAKGVEISGAERTAARMAILLHDIGHGPFSHALEHSLVKGISHEAISKIIIRKLNEEYDGLLDRTLQVFDHSYPKPYLQQLVSSQLDVDRMDFLSRDSFYTGVSEGVIGYDRILKMLTVRNNELMVEEKGIYSVEKFIIARRLMYWQVYLHKTVLAAELLLVNILKRAKELCNTGVNISASGPLMFFLSNNISEDDMANGPGIIDLFCRLDDSDVLSAVKHWTCHEDKILSLLCTMFLQRKLYKVIFSPNLEENTVLEMRKGIQQQLHLDEHQLSYFIFTGKTSNSTYNIFNEEINIALKDGGTCNIADVENSLVNKTLAVPVVKNYLCYFKI